MSLETSLSGITAAQTEIDTIGNNVANVDTTGFKESRAQFASLLGASLETASVDGESPGIGAELTRLAQAFTEGNIVNTGGPLDVAINGAGFFQLQTSQGTAYSRNGAFQLDSEGFLTDDVGDKLMGFSAVPGSSALGTPEPLQIDRSNIAPVATSSLTLDVSLPATDSAIDTTANPFSISNTASYNESTTTTVFDSLGVGRTLTTFFTKVSGSGSPPQWKTHFGLTDSSGALVASGAGPSLVFNSSGLLVSGSGTVGPISPLPDGAAPLSFTMAFNGSSLSNVPFGVNSIVNDGDGGGLFTGIQIGVDGTVKGQFSNGATKAFGTIALANFANLQGLQQLSGTLWAETTASGPAVLGTPQSAGLGSLQARSLESSNVDLSDQLVKLISAQQFFQGNVQAINIDRQDITRLLALQ